MSLGVAQRSISQICKNGHVMKCKLERLLRTKVSLDTQRLVLLREIKRLKMVSRPLNKTDDLILNLTLENVTQHSRIE